MADSESRRLPGRKTYSKLGILTAIGDHVDGKVTTRRLSHRKLVLQLQLIEGPGSAPPSDANETGVHGAIAQIYQGFEVQFSSSFGCDDEVQL